MASGNKHRSAVFKPRRSGTPLTRRTLLAGGAAAASLLMMQPSAKSFEVVHTTLPLPSIPERPGIVPWRTLAKVTGDGWTQAFTFAPEIEALDGTEVAIEGYMMPYDDEATQRRFRLTAYAAHCPYCMPGGMPSLVEVDATEPVPATARRITMKKRIELIRGEGYGLAYQLAGGRLA